MRHFEHVKIPKEPRQGKCDVCTSLKRKIQSPGTSVKSKEELKRMLEVHREQVVMERNKYWVRRDLAMGQPSVFLSLIMDGMDQSVTCLPNHNPRVRKCLPFADHHVFAVLNHATRKTKFFLCHDGIRKDSNLSIAAMLWSLAEVPQPWPPVLFMQVVVLRSKVHRDVNAC